MGDNVVLRRVVLKARHRSTGYTVHMKEDRELPRPAELRIVKYPNDPGYYLFYCDESGSEMTDTYHDSIEDALVQAKREFEVRSEDWQVVTANK